MAVLAKRATSGQVWCPSPPGVPPLSPCWLPSPPVRVSPPRLQGLGPQGTGAQPPAQVAGTSRASSRAMPGPSHATPRGSRRVFGPGGLSPWTEGCSWVGLAPLQRGHPQRSCRVWGAALRGQSPSAVPGRHLHRYEGNVSGALLPTGLAPQRARHGFRVILEMTAWCFLI